jgi:DNA mismatch endonuclease (patch repair protein)
MADVLTKVQRSFNMSRIRGADTKPELAVRRLVTALGFRYRLRCPDLAGKPDLVLRAKKKAIFVHGCFWHRHACRFGRATPKTRASFWKAKFEANKKRDAKAARALRRDGWSVLVIWECQLRNPEKLTTKLRAFLNEKPLLNKRKGV